MPTIIGELRSVILFDLTCNYNSIMININKLGTCRNIQDKCDLRDTVYSYHIKQVEQIWTYWSVDSNF